MSSKIFTIIVCTYNGERFLSKAIESILKQEGYDDLVDKFIIVDNGSNDRTKDIIDSYSKFKNNIIYSFEEKPGLSNARLNGVKQTQSSWIIFVDDDNELQSQWLINAEAYIEENNNIGAFNGAVIPKSDSNLSASEKDVLSIIYKGLACTHLDIKDIDVKQINHPNTKPFGAGLVIIARCLKILVQEGWLNLPGRTKDNLSSGEDDEMCDYIKNQGYGMGYNAKMLMYHYIPNNRLSEEYAIKLYNGFAYSTYLFFKYRKIDILRRIICLIISLENIAIYKIKLIGCNSNTNKIRLKIGIESSKVLIKHILNDFLFIKR